MKTKKEEERKFAWKNPGTYVRTYVRSRSQPSGAVRKVGCATSNKGKKADIWEEGEALLRSYKEVNKYVSTLAGWISSKEEQWTRQLGFELTPPSSYFLLLSFFLFFSLSLSLFSSVACFKDKVAGSSTGLPDKTLFKLLKPLLKTLRRVWFFPEELNNIGLHTTYTDEVTCNHQLLSEWRRLLREERKEEKWASRLLPNSPFLAVTTYIQAGSKRILPRNN